MDSRQQGEDRQGLSLGRVTREGRPRVLCPVCQQPSSEEDFEEVDVGVGVIRGNYKYYCKIHGLWSEDTDYSARLSTVYLIDLQETLCVPF